MSESNSETGSTGSLPSWVVPVAIVAIVAVLTVVALMRGPAQFDPTTPEGVVQTYLAAFSDGRYEDAFAALDPERFDGCRPDDLATYGNDPFSAVLQDSQQRGDSADVRVVMRFGESGPLGSGWENRETFQLSNTSGQWLIVGEPWPWFRWDCGEWP